MPGVAVFFRRLAHGNISPRQIYSEIKRYEAERTSNQSTYWVIFELLWRDYFRFVALKYGNKLFFADGILGRNVEWKTNQTLFNAWKGMKVNHDPYRWIYVGQV